MAGRELNNQRTFDLKKFFFQWEWMLVLIFLAINIMNTGLSPYYLQPTTFLDAPMSFLDKAFLVLPMVFVIVLGEIDISIGSTVALSSVLMAMAFAAGLPMPLAVVLCLCVATICGFINGTLITRFKELPPMIITLSTMTIYRGVAYILLEDRAQGGFPSWFKYLGWGYVGPIPFIAVVFAVFCLLFAMVLHKTRFGREIYAMGNNATTCLYSGIQVDRNKLIVYTAMGFMAGVTALFLTSRMGSTRPNIATGYEMEAIAMVVLGGVSTAGGKGRMIGAILAVFIIGFLRYGLGLINVQAQAILIIIGMLLILSVLVSNLKFSGRKSAFTVFQKQ